jgi:DNA-binding GntR family transcriptional regulator
MKRNGQPAQTSSDRVYRHLKHDIVTCDLLPGRSLSEQELCRRYHTSRTPVREACRRLENEGLVRIIPYRGYFVAPLTMAEYHNLNEVQLIVEPAAAALAAQRATPAQLKVIQAAAARVYRAGDRKSYYAFLEDNFRLHVGIAESSANESLVNIISEVHTRLMRFFYLVISVDSYGSELVTEHRSIVQAIGKRDADQARRRSTEHIVRTMQRSANLMLAAGGMDVGGYGPSGNWLNLTRSLPADWTLWEEHAGPEPPVKKGRR